MSVGWAYACGVADELEGLPSILAALLEGVAARLQMDRGRWRAEFIFENGRLRQVFRHDERIPADKLDELFPPVA